MLRTYRRIRPTRLVCFAALAIGAAAPAAAHNNSNSNNNNNGDNDNLPVFLDRTVDATAQDTCSPGNLWQGSGNPATTFQRKRDTDAGIELAIKAIVRQGADIRSTYVDDQGLVHIEVPAGAQPSNPSRAAWNFTYSYDVALNPTNPALDQYDAELWIDLDPSANTKYMKLKLARLGSPPASAPCNAEPDTNGLGWKLGNTVVIGDDEGTSGVTQNSQNYAFYASQIDTNRHMPGIQPYTFGPGQFDVVMKIKRRWHGGQATTLHAVFDVVTTPTP